MILHRLDVLTLGVVINKLKCYKRMSSLNRGWTSWRSTSGHMAVASWANMNMGSMINPKSDQHPGSSLFSLLDHKDFKNPSSSPIALPPKDLYFLPVDGMCSLSDMHGYSILRILVLDCHSVLCHMNSQRPPGLSNISYWAFSTGIEYTMPFMSIIPGLPFTFVRDFLIVFLELKTICTPSGLHVLPIPVGISIWLCDGGSLQCQTSPLDSGVSCSWSSGPCGWVSCTH